MKTAVSPGIGPAAACAMTGVWTFSKQFRWMKNIVHMLMKLYVQVAQRVLWSARNHLMLAIGTKNTAKLFSLDEMI
jgi:hypothetical protein